MNKTVNINIGGLFFHIDEDAFQKLSRYFDAIKRSLSNSSGKEEIMKDIEMRVAELLTDRQKTDKHVVNIKDVDEVVAVMGQPEDYRIDDEGQSESTTYYASSGRKKLYRDKDKGLIAGVCTGLGHYFGVDAVWIKLLFIIITWAGGAGVLAYLILWIVTPKAITTSEKLEMTGEPVTISNIEKKVTETYENVTNKFKNADYNNASEQVKTSTDRVGGALMSVFGAFAKVLGAMIIVFASLSLVGILIGLFTFSSTSFMETPWQRYVNAVNYTDIPLWSFGLLGFLAIGIPLFFFLILGLKLLITNMKPVNNIIKYSLLAIWIFSVAALIFIGIKQSTEMAFDGRIIQKETLQLQPNDTLYIKFGNNDYFSRESNGHEDFIFTQDSLKNEVIYSNNIDFEIKESNTSLAYIEIEKKAEGKSFREANERAEKIKYSFKLTNNQLILDNYLLTEMASKYRNQRVNIYLYLPVGTIFKADDTVQNYDTSDNDFFNLHYSDDNYLYKVEQNQVKCLNCPKEEDEYGDIDNDIETEDVNVIDENDTVKTISVKVNGKEVITKKEGKSEGTSLKIDENGIIIKTK